MKRKDYLTTVIGTLIIVLVIGILFGYCCAKVYGAEVSVVDSMAGGERAKIEGGGMPCMVSVAPEKPSFTAETESVEEVTTEEPKAAEAPALSVDGHRLGKGLEDYLFQQLDARNIGWFYEISLCQIYQESRFNCSAVNLAHMDFGLCQHYQGSFPTSARESGLVEYDIMNPIDSIYVYAYLMAKYINEEGSVDMALSRYYTGQSNFNQSYVTAVRQWERTLK